MADNEQAATELAEVNDKKPEEKKSGWNPFAKILDDDDEDEDGPPHHGVQVDTEGNADTEVTDAETGQKVKFMFGCITTMGVNGDKKLSWIVSRLKSAGLITHTYNAKSGAKYRITRIGATIARLEEFADSTNYWCTMDAEKIKAASQAKGLDIKNPARMDLYEPFEHLSGPFEDTKRDLYVPFTEGDYLKLVKRLILGNPNYAGGARGSGLDIDKLRSGSGDNKWCKGFFALHDHALRDELAAKWLPLSPPWKLPIDDIAEYFGEEIGFYFAFLRHLTTSLIPLSVLAVIAIVYFFAVTYQMDQKMYGEAVFALCSVCTYSVILDSWNWHQNRIAHLWDSFGATFNLPARPGFKGVVMENPVTGRLEIAFPSYMRRPRNMQSFAISATVIVTLIGAVVSIFVFKAFLESQEDDESSSPILLLPSVLNSVQITVFGELYKIIARVLTSYENHRTLAEHNSALFKKLTFFYFINYYATLFFIAFAKKNYGGGCASAPLSSGDYCGYELAVQVAVVFFINDFGVRFSNSVVVPWMLRHLKKKLADADDEIVAESMGRIEKEFRYLEHYDPTRSLVQDYIELFIQFGYLVLFGAAFPPAVFLAFITNYVETRTDGNKLLYEFRRVLPNRVDGIGEPLRVFYFLLYLGIPVNAGLVVYTFGAFDNITTEYRVWIFGGLVVIAFFLLNRLDVIYPNLPKKTEIQLARQDLVYRRVILEQPPDEDELNLDIDPSMIGKLVEDSSHRGSFMEAEGIADGKSDNQL